MEAITANGSGSGDGSGYGYGDGSGFGYGDGSGFGESKQPADNTHDLATLLIQTLNTSTQ